MSTDVVRVSSLVMTGFGGFRQATRNSEETPWARFQGGNAGSNPVGGTSGDLSPHRASDLALQVGLSATGADAVRSGAVTSDR